VILDQTEIPDLVWSIQGDAVREFIPARIELSSARDRIALSRELFIFIRRPKRLGSRRKY
jgi:hypothetical protein